MGQAIAKVLVKGPFAQPLDYLLPAGQADACQIGVRVKVPLGHHTTVGVISELAAHSKWPAERLKNIISIIDSSPVVSTSVLQLLKRLAQYYHQPMGLVFDAALPQFLKSHKTPKLSQNNYQLTPQGEQALADSKLAHKAPRQYQILAALQAHESLSQSDILQAGATHAGLKAAVDKGIIQKKQTMLTPPAPSHKLRQQPELSDEQAQALASCQQAQGGEVLMLEGVTGSGKTEVYLRWLEQITAQGRQALLLVPEIGLTPQTLQRLRERLAVPVFSYHSQMSAKERWQTWQWASQITPAVVVGTRSALFLPFCCLGAMVIDESHDGSYYQQNTIFFSARDMAVMRARIDQVPILLGSATPSLETMRHALTGHFRHLQLTKRLGAGRLPQINIIDMRQQPVKGGLSHALLSTIKEHLQANGQVMLFLNRRGFAPVLLCHQCGWSAKHQGCMRHYTWHQQENKLRCHNCEVELPTPKYCPECKSVDSFVAVGVGTERLEAALTQLFPQHRICRIDRDTVKQKGQLEQALSAIHDNQADIIIGTQMIAKGHHFANLSLVAIVDSDQALYSVDFRALERLGQLVTQVAGRAGRESSQGRMYIQTHKPDHPLLRLLLQQGYHAFAQALLEQRQQMQWPPFAHLALLRAQSKSQQLVCEFMRQQKQYLQTWQLQHTQLLGPVPSLVSLKAGVHSWQLLFHSTNRRELHQMLQALEQHLSQRKYRQLRWQLIVDPIEV